MIKIIVDSTTDLPSEYFKKYDIKVVPLIININEQTYKDKKTITVEEVYEALRNGKDLKTSQPNPQDIFEVMEDLAKDNHDIIFITISKKLSGTYQTINIVTEDLQEKYPNIKIKLIDSKGGSAIPGLMALQASYLIKENYTFDEIITTLEHMASHGQHIFTVNDLKYLFKSGRLGRATALIGNLLHVKPILHVDDGEIKLLKKVRGRNKALKTIIDLVEEKIASFPNQAIAIMYAAEEEVALEVKTLLEERIGEKEVFIDQIGSALGTHIGIGGVGLFFFTEQPPYYINSTK